jgi:hypothetical protein
MAGFRRRATDYLNRIRILGVAPAERFVAHLNFYAKDVQIQVGVPGPNPVSCDK